MWKNNGSRAELARQLNLSRSAISSIISELLEVGLVAEAGGFTGSSLHFARLWELAQNGDPRAVELWLEFGRYLGVAISSMLNVYNPAVLLIGGEITVGRPWLQHSLELEIECRTLWINRRDVHIAFSSLGQNVTLLGASMILIGELFTPFWIEHLYGYSKKTIPNKVVGMVF